MKRKCRQTLAIILSSIFLLLNIAVEYSHQHITAYNTNSAFSNSENVRYDFINIYNHNFTCVACLYGLTHLAPAVSFQSLKPDRESVFTAKRPITFYLVITSIPFHLRAPPVV